MLSALSYRADESPGPQARKRQENKPALSKLIARIGPGAVRECDVPVPPCSAFRLLSSLSYSDAWPFAVAKATQVYKGPQHRIFSSTCALQSQLHVCFATSTRFGQLYVLAANSMLWPPTVCSGGQLYALTANSMP